MPDKGTGSDAAGKDGRRPEAEPASPDKPAHVVERRTALRGLSIGTSRESKTTIRRHTMLDLLSQEPEIPYVRFEQAFRGLVCSLLERQDRMNETLFLKINDLEYRLKDLEAELEDMKQSGYLQKKGGGP